MMGFDDGKYMARAKQIDAEARKRWDAVNADQTLTPQGKAPKLAEVNEWRKGQVQALQREVSAELLEYVTGQYVKVAQRRDAQAKRERALLAEGNPIAFMLAERELAGAETDELVLAVERARDPWEREVLGRLAWLEAQKRGKGQDAAVARMKIQAMMTTPETGEVKRMEDDADYWKREGEKFIADLDRRDYAQRMVNKGLARNPDNVE
jgi:hypothetical protein